MKTLIALLFVSLFALSPVFAKNIQVESTNKTVPKRPPVNDDGPGDDDKPPFQIP